MRARGRGMRLHLASVAELRELKGTCDDRARLLCRELLHFTTLRPVVMRPYLCIPAATEERAPAL